MSSFEWPAYTKTIHRSAYPAIEPTNPSNSVAGKVVVVTGGGAGVGRHISEAFSKAGAKAVAILGRREDVLKTAKAEIEKAGNASILTYKADVTDETALNAAFASVEKEVGKVDIVVANAGFLPTITSATEADLKDWWKGFEINILGTLLTFRAFVAHKSDKAPTFISVNTGAAHAGSFPNLSGYTVSKLGAAQLIASLQVENQDMRITSYHPGVLETDMNAKSGMPVSKDDFSLPAGFAVWLASPAAEFTRGRFLWAHWDVDELLQMKDEILEKNELVMGLSGWPKQVEMKVVE